MESSHGWAQGNPEEICGAASTTIGPCIAIFTVGLTLHLYEGLHCGEFFDWMPLEQFPPFTLPSAPAAADIQAFFFYNPSDTLYVIAAQ